MVARSFLITILAAAVAVLAATNEPCIGSGGRAGAFRAIHHFDSHLTTETQAFASAPANARTMVASPLVALVPKILLALNAAPRLPAATAVLVTAAGPATARAPRSPTNALVRAPSSAALLLQQALVDTPSRRFLASVHARPSLSTAQRKSSPRSQAEFARSSALATARAQVIRTTAVARRQI